MKAVEKLLAFTLTLCLMVGALYIIFEAASVEYPIAIPEQVVDKPDVNSLLATHESTQEKMALLCRIKRNCRLYAEARQICATATNFEVCMRIKLGDFQSVGPNYCRDDGTVKIPSDAVPRSWQCKLQELGVNVW